MLDEKMLTRIVKRNVGILRKKNKDYGTTNLLTCGTLGICVRLQDKVSRLLNLTKNGGTKAHFESVADTALDVSNYGLLLQLMLEGGLTYDPPVGTGTQKGPKRTPKGARRAPKGGRSVGHPAGTSYITALVPRVRRK